MYDTAIQKVVCQAVVSDHYRTRLLGSDRAEVLRSSGLDAKALEALLNIHAETIEEFAAGIERIIRQWKQAGSRPSAIENGMIRGLIAMEVPRRNG